LSPIYLGVSVMDLRKIRRWVGRVLLAAGLAVGVFLGTQTASGAAGAAQSNSSVATAEADGDLSTTTDPHWT
jgi:hypothetical protein